MIIAIAAVDEESGIGKNNTIPWNNTDFPWFKFITFGYPCIYGSKTYYSMGRTLPGRLNLILSRNESFPLLNTNDENVKVFNNKENVLETIKTTNNQNFFVIGGNAIYTEFLEHTDELLLTRIQGIYKCDTFFPSYEGDFKKIAQFSLANESIVERWIRK